MREPSLHVDLPGPAEDSVEGPQQHVWGVPAEVEPLHVKSVGKDILIVQLPASKVPAYSFNDKKIFNDRMKTTKTPATNIALIRAEVVYVVY
jgi:hypothetical protein